MSRRFVRVPVEAIRDWPRTDLLTYVALAATRGKAVTLAEVRKLARIRKQDLLRSLKKLMRRGEVEQTRDSKGRYSYQVTPLEPWARMLEAALPDRELSKTDVLVYIALASFANRMGGAWPAGKALATRAGVSARAVYASLATLQRRYISCWYNKTGQRHYVLLRKPKSIEVRLVERREDELTSIWRAAMRGEDPPMIPEKYIDEIEVE